VVAVVEEVVMVDQVDQEVVEPVVQMEVELLEVEQPIKVVALVELVVLPVIEVDLAVLEW
tara:strand:+ start:396 stop:575 length:180 start_codon:yes stop_codon:yes gene_type:complete